MDESISVPLSNSDRRSVKALFSVVLVPSIVDLCVDSDFVSPQPRRLHLLDMLEFYLSYKLVESFELLGLSWLTEIFKSWHPLKTATPKALLPRSRAVGSDIVCFP